MYRFSHVDVFTEQRFEGNPLAVFPDAEGLSDQQMQRIANEMNLSETAFVLRTTREGCDARVRIFTPAYEMLFAGHPTIGTAFVLASLRRVPAGKGSIVFEEGVGPVSVRYEGPAQAPLRAWLLTPPITFGPVFGDRAACAAAASLTSEDLLEGIPLEVAGAGPRFLYLPVRDRATVDRAQPDLAAISRLLRDERLIGIFVFAVERERGEFYSRMFAPDAGIGEDPATGSATGPLAAFAVRHALIDARPGGSVRLLSEQGVKMGRRSLLHIHVTFAHGSPATIEIGGSAVHVLDGELDLP